MVVAFTSLAAFTTCYKAQGAHRKTLPRTCGHAHQAGRLGEHVPRASTSRGGTKISGWGLNTDTGFPNMLQLQHNCFARFPTKVLQTPYYQSGPTSAFPRSCAVAIPLCHPPLGPKAHTRGLGRKRGKGNRPL